MTSSEFQREVARTTGDDFSTISRRGFIPLTFGPIDWDHEYDRPPQTIDWDSESHEVRMVNFEELVS